MSRLDKIERLKDKLRATDYIAIKYAEGIDCSEYGEWKAQRQELRDSVNRYQNMTDEEYEQLTEVESC
jgi:hypothetical protein